MTRTWSSCLPTHGKLSFCLPMHCVAYNRACFCRRPSWVWSWCLARFTMLINSAPPWVWRNMWMAPNQKLNQAFVELSFWFSTRFTRKKLDHSPGSYLYSVLWIFEKYSVRFYSVIRSFGESTRLEFLLGWSYYSVIQIFGERTRLRLDRLLYFFMNSVKV